MFSGLRKQLGRLSIRLTLWHALLFLTAALTVLGLTYLVMEQRLVTQEREAIQFRLDQYVIELQDGGLPAVLLRAAQRKGREQKPLFIRIADAGNHTLYLRDADEWTDFEPDQLAKKAPPASAESGWVTLRSRTGVELLLRFSRLPDGRLIEVGRSTFEMRQLLAGFSTATLVVLLVFLPASVMGGAFLASRALRPVQHLTAVAEQIVATASFEARVQSNGTNDELDALVQLFNKMLARIDRLVRGMRDSLDNVAHDLRTPMTRLRQKAQTALQSGADIETARDALADCVEEAERVMTLLNTLMDIAETESGLIQLQRAPLEVGDLIYCAVDSYTEVAEEKGVTVTDEVPEGLRVSGDAGALRRVFANLLDNAIKFTPAGGQVRITANRTHESVAIHISDTGSGIASEDLPRIWDRLFRGDKSRSERGLGLGLSFVRAIVESHGGKASVSCERGDGTVATIVLPAEGAKT